MNESPQDPEPKATVQSAEPEAAPREVLITANSTPAEAPPSPVIPAESPSLKRRQKENEDSAATTAENLLVTKRVRPEHGPVKVLPIRYEFCEVEDIVILIANMISELIETNDGLPLRKGILTRFHSR